MREERRPFWKRRLVWLLVLLATIAIAAITLASILLHQRSTEKTTTTKTSTSQNSTTSSVASSGLFLKDGTTWNMQVYMQTSSGAIQFQMSLDGKTFGAKKNVSLEVAPMVRSPLSATAATDSTGVVYVSLGNGILGQI